MNTVLEYEKFLNQLNADVTVAVKAGLAQRNDLYRVQLKQNELSVNKLKLVNGIQMATMALCQHIGVSYDSTYQVKNILDPVELPVKYYDHSGASVVNARIESQMLNTAVEAEKLQKKMAVGEYLPQLSLGGMGFSTKAMDKVNSNVMAFATVSVPISDWWGGSHKIKESQFKIDRATTRLHETKELLELQAQQTKNELNETYAQIQTSQNSIEQSKENLRIVSDNFKAGVSSVSDLLEAQAMHQQAKTDYSDAVCTYHLKIAAYLQATGNYR
jgi:outer membrane protein TolC